MLGDYAVGLVATTLVLLQPGGSPSTQPGPLANWREQVSGLEFTLLPAGSFTMGSPADEPGREAQELQHRVTLSRAFWLSRTEVTQAAWRQVMGSNPAQHVEAGPAAPVEQVSWHEVQEFLARLGERAAGSRFRLPTEAEWEYACRAGTTTPYSTGVRLTTDQANYDGRGPLPGQAPGAFRSRTTPVGSFSPNAWGLFDLHGNVWEWTADAYCPYPDHAVSDPRPGCGAELMVIRGGSYLYGADSARCALRYTHRPQDRGPSLGFRIVREPISSGTAAATSAADEERMRR